MPLNLNRFLFINKLDVVLRAKPISSTKNNAKNHLILGDFAKWTRQKKGQWIEVYCRGNRGWLRKDEVTNQRMLEINFVDIGQGDGCHIVTPKDEIILIDAGEGTGFHGEGEDNMARFINWRYNLRDRIVAGADGKSKNSKGVKKPMEIDHVVISHPDLDHYYGFLNIFGNKKLKTLNVYHNGLVERPIDKKAKKTWYYDLGRKVPKNADPKSAFHIADTVRTNKEMHDLIKKYPKSQKKYLSTLRQARENNKKIKFTFLNKSKKFLAHFNEANNLSLEVLAPLAEKIKVEGKTKLCLKKLGSEGVTKNGHSVVLKLKYKKLKVLLGGDLNSNSQDYIAQYYSGENDKLSTLERKIKRIREKICSNTSLSKAQIEKLEKDLKKAIELQEKIILKTREDFQVDIAKACHHGASDVLDSFLRTINPVATVISSGDRESHNHPRPDALGAFGVTSRGTRPLIFSTEIARSTNEFSYPAKFYKELKELDEQRIAARTKKEKDRFSKAMEEVKDRNVAKYGMITVRTDGERVIIAQKLEVPRNPGSKWDIYELVWNDKLSEFEYKS